MSAVTQVKICCISSLDEAQLAIAAGASAIGLVSQMPSGPGVIPEARIAQIAAELHSSVSSFLLTARQDAASIARQHAACGTTTLQLVDAVATAERRLLRQLLPSVKLVQVVHVINEHSVDEALAAAEDVDALLLDSGNPGLAVKELGGTGRTHNWNLSRQIREASRVPVYLAGGLSPVNVALAIATVRPFGVDVCSGVRFNGQLDANRLTDFMQAVKSAL